MTLKYKIELHTYWHCGSGLSRGADLDALVVKDKNGLPFIPGKTVKGLMREAAFDYINLTKAESQPTLFQELFGTVENRSETYFGNACLSKEEQEWIVANNATKHLYDRKASTAINDNGTAKKHSLRSMEIVVPCTLEGEVVNAPEGARQLLKAAVGLIKCLGTNRSHGLGRCTITIEEKGGNQ